MTRPLILFQLIYWGAAAGLLFLYGLSYGHWEIALIRNLYFPVVGFLLSTAMIPLYNRAGYGDGQKTYFLVALACGLAAMLTGAILNPITFALLGEEISVLPLEYLSTDTLYFALFYFVWSLLYIGRHRPGAGAQDDDQGSHSITVESLGEIRTLNLDDLECVRSSGDYVELVSGTNTYLKKETLSNFEGQLPKVKFRRVHRTAIINIDKVARVTSQGRGVYEITLASGQKVTSSRSFKDEISDILPEG